MPERELERADELMSWIVTFVHIFPKSVSIAIGALLATLVIFVVAAVVAGRAAEKRAEEQRRRAKELEFRQQEAARQKKQQLEQRAAALKASKRKLEEQARLEDKQRVDALGKQGAALLKLATSSVQRLVSTEAAKGGWLGDVDFAPDLEEIEANLLKARALRRKADELSALSTPDVDDREIIAEAKSTTAHLERRTKERVELLEKCGSEARLIDESIRREREGAQLAVKREELHGELAAMLFETEATRATHDQSSTDAVMSRVQAYRDIKGEIERARDDAETPIGADRGTDGESSVTWAVAPLRQAWKWISE